MTTHIAFDPTFWANPDVLGLSSAGKLVYVHLVTNGHYSGLYPVSLAAIAEETGLTTDDVAREINALDDRNLVRYDAVRRVIWVVKRTKKFFELQGGNSANQKKGIAIHFLDSRLRSTALIGQYLKYYEHLNIPYTGKPCEGSSVRPVPREEPVVAPKEPSKKAVAPQEYTDMFADFWKEYPARNGKKIEKAETFQRYCRIKKEELPAVNLAAVNYANCEMVKAGVGIKDPKRFLMGGRGEEYWRNWVTPEKEGGTNGGHGKHSNRNTTENKRSRGDAYSNLSREL